MPENSIRINLDKDTTISEIKLELGGDFGKKKKFIIVEGETDVKFLNYYLWNITLIESFSGKSGVLEIIQALGDDKRIIGICDKDYDEGPKFKNLVFYDGCNLEMMCLMSKNVRQRLIYDLFYDTHISESEIEEFLFRLSFISCIRMLSSKMKWMISFTILENMSKLVDEKNYAIDCEKTLFELNKSNNCIFSNNPEIKNAVISKHRKVCDEYRLVDITNGHDFIRYITYVRRFEKPRRNISIGEVENIIRSSYSKDDFFESDLSKSLSSFLS